MVTFYHVHLSELLSKNKSYTHLSLKQDHPTPEFPLKLPYFTPTSTETVTISLLGPTTKKEKSVRKKKSSLKEGTIYLFEGMLLNEQNAESRITRLCISVLPKFGVFHKMI